VSRVTECLSEDFEAFRKRDLSGEQLLYLELDGTYLRYHQGTEKKEPILVATGYRIDGTRALLHISPGNRESYENRSYNAYRYYYLRQNGKAIDELDRIEKTLFSMTQGGGEHLVRELERPPETLADAQAAILGSPGDSDSATVGGRTHPGTQPALLFGYTRAGHRWPDDFASDQGSARPECATTTAAEAVLPLEQSKRIDPDTELWIALQQMDRDGFNRLPVTGDDHVIGMLSREDVIIYLRMLQELGA
jgi:CBS domain-containing protein